MTDNITFVETDDWEACYLNGQLVDQNHSLNPAMLLQDLERMGLDVNVERKEWDAEHAWSFGHLPENLEDLPAEAIVGEIT